MHACMPYAMYSLTSLFKTIIDTRGEGDLRPPSPLVRVAVATLISREEGVSSEFIELSVYNLYIKTQAHSKCYTVTIVVKANVWY